MFRKGGKMNEGFSGEPILTEWHDGERNMSLAQEFYYVDPKGKKWVAPAGSVINGATIPRELWSIVGSPFVGKYRRASVIHDVAVGEFGDYDVSSQERKKADRMFYHACRYDGCSKRFATLLYIGVRLGAWLSFKSSSNYRALIEEDFIDTRVFSMEENQTTKAFWEIADNASFAIENEDLDSLDAEIEKIIQ